MYAQRVSIARLTRTGSPGKYAEAYAPPHATNVICKVSQPAASEIRQAEALGVEYAIPVHFPTTLVDVQATDKLTVTTSPVGMHVGQELVVRTVTPPSQPRALRVECERFVGR